MLKNRLTTEPQATMSVRFSAVILLAAAVVLTACNTTEKEKQENASNKYELVNNWPQLPVGYVLGNPTGIGIDSDQHIFVFSRGDRKWTEPFPESLISSNTILELDRNTGKIMNSWGANVFIMPHGLTVDKQNNVWVTDVGLHQVFKFTHDGKLLMKWGTGRIAGTDSTHFNLPTDVAVAEDGSFYVSDGYGNSRVVKFSATGNYLFSWGTMGNKPGEFNLPHAIDLDEKGNVYVADRENSRIQEFDANGKFINQWNNPNYGKMYSLAVNKKDNALIGVDYVVDDTVPKGSDILFFEKSNVQATAIGRSGSYTGPVCRYHDVAIDDEGNLYVGDILGNSIQKFRPVKK